MNLYSWKFHVICVQKVMLKFNILNIEWIDKILWKEVSFHPHTGHFSPVKVVQVSCQHNSLSSLPQRKTMPHIVKSDFEILGSACEKLNASIFFLMAWQSFMWKFAPRYVKSSPLYYILYFFHAIVAAIDSLIINPLLWITRGWRSHVTAVTNHYFCCITT